MCVEFSAIRREMATKADLAAVRADTATKADLQEAVVVVTTELTQQIQATQNLTRALHEDIVARIATLGDGRKHS